MEMKTLTLKIKTKPDTDIINITSKVSEAVKQSQLRNGIISIFVPGSTASVSTMEFEPNLVMDIKQAVERIAPSEIEYKHHETWDDRNGKSHVRATLLGPGITVPFQDKKLLLGAWQHITLLDFDVPAREREIVITIIGE